METTDATVEKFLKYDYAETKDLLKTFITLASASLVLSLTFAEKVIGFSRAAPATQTILFCSWLLFIASLILAGLGLCFIAAAAGKILYGEIPLLTLNYYSLALISWVFVLLAGTSYVGVLVALTIAAAQAIMHLG